MELIEIEDVAPPPYSDSNIFSVENYGHRIELKIVGYEEPNNGRELYVVELFINDIDRTRDYFDDWNRIPLGGMRRHYQFSGMDKRFCFIPAESKMFLIDIQTLQKIELPDFDFLHLSHRLNGNIFDKNKHLLITEKQLFVTDLYSLESKTYKVSTSQAIEWAYFIDDNNLRLIHCSFNKCSLFNLETGLVTDMGEIAAGETFKDISSWSVYSYKKNNDQSILEMIWHEKIDDKYQRRVFMLKE